MQKFVVFAVSIAATVAVGLSMFPGIRNPAAADERVPAKKPDEAAVERTRKVTKNLDNIYKQVIVLVTDKYVNTEDDFPAGSAAVILFRNISESGNHSVRLIDATGKPYEEKNVANDDFERNAIKRLKAGDKIHEKVIEKDGKSYLRTVTPVPVVMDKCIMCHPHYADVKKGDPIGAISYTVPIE